MTLESPGVEFQQHTKPSGTISAAIEVLLKADFTFTESILERAATGTHAVARADPFLHVPDVVIQPPTVGFTGIYAHRALTFKELSVLLNAAVKIFAWLVAAGIRCVGPLVN